jgi:hypothetical protein
MSCVRSDVLLTDYNFFSYGDNYRLVCRKEDPFTEIGDAAYTPT